MIHPPKHQSLSHPPQTRNHQPLLPHPLLQPPNQFPKPLRLPPQRHLIDMLLPERHLRPILHAHPVIQSIYIQRFTPKGAVLDFRDAEIDSFTAVFLFVADHEAHDAGGEEVRKHWLGKGAARPGGWVVDWDRVEVAGHGEDATGRLGGVRFEISWKL